MRKNVRCCFACAVALAFACNLQSLPVAAPPTAAALPATVSPTPGKPAATATGTASPSPTPTETPPATPTATRSLPYSITETTRFEGDKTYTCDAGGCWREDGRTAGPPEALFPDIGMENEEVRLLLESIGLPSDVASDDAERWRRTRRVWEWMKNDTLPLGAPGQEESWNYLSELMKSPVDHWPSIGEMADVYARFHVLPLGACNSKAFTFATLLYRAGVRPDSTAVVTAKAESAQHLFVVVRLDGRWRFLDPTCIPEHPALAGMPESVGCTGADYAHPFQLDLMPGSALIKPMLAE
jgi:hypothetical protein